MIFRFATNHASLGMTVLIVIESKIARDQRFAVESRTDHHNPVISSEAARRVFGRAAQSRDLVFAAGFLDYAMTSLG